MSCSLDRGGQRSLMRCAGTGNSSGKDLAALRNILTKLGSILVIDRAVLAAENADLLLAMEVVLTSVRSAAVTILLGVCHNILQIRPGLSPDHYESLFEGV